MLLGRLLLLLRFLLHLRLLSWLVMSVLMLDLLRVHLMVVMWRLMLLRLLLCRLLTLDKASARCSSVRIHHRIVLVGFHRCGHRLDGLARPARRTHAGINTVGQLHASPFERTVHVAVTASPTTSTGRMTILAGIGRRVRVHPVSHGLVASNPASTRTRSRSVM